MKTVRIYKPTISYRQFCLLQNSWIDLWTLDDEEEVCLTACVETLRDAPSPDRSEHL